MTGIQWDGTLPKTTINDIYLFRKTFAFMFLEKKFEFISLEIIFIGSKPFSMKRVNVYLKLCKVLLFLYFKY